MRKYLLVISTIILFPLLVLSQNQNTIPSPPVPLTNDYVEYVSGIHDLVWFRSAIFRSSDGAPAPFAPELEFTGFSRDFGYYIVQFEDETFEDYKQQIKETAKGTPLGAEIFYYVPNRSWIFRLSKSSLKDVEDLPFVAWVHPLEPQFRVLPSLLNEKQEPDTFDNMVGIIIQIFQGDDYTTLTKELEKYKVQIVDTTRGAYHEWIKIRVRPEFVRDLAITAARYEGTEWVERYYPVVSCNDWSRWLVQSFNYTGMTSGSRLYAQMSVNTTHVPIYRRGIYGQNQLVGYADSGLDTLSIYFCHQGVTVPKVVGWTIPTDTGHRKIRAYNAEVSGSWSFRDDDTYHGGHGTHVGGSIGGEDQTNSPTSGTYNAGDGMAPLCRLVFTDIGTRADQYLYPPSDLNTLFGFAQNAGAYIHSNSWGSSSPTSYNTRAQQCDQFMWNNKNFLVFFAAGNDNTSGIRVASSAVAKNIVTVGATESGSGSGYTTWTNPGSSSLNNPQNMASFSSHGPTDEGMMKPNLAIPGGWYVFSADYITNGSMCHTGMTYMGGTSMATPTCAGMTALIRQYFMDGYYPTGAAVTGNARTPSGALMKAMLILGTRNMTGSYTIDAVNNSGSKDAPSQGQGWGRVVLDDCLYFNDAYSSDTRKLWIKDTTGLVSTGNSVTYTLYTGASTTETLKVVMSFTDYPGSPAAGTSGVNDLNLTVTIGGNTYRGNVFATSGSRSITGGSYDQINRDEVVWLPPMPNQTLQITVSAFVIRTSPQPFALAVAGDISTTPNLPNLSYHSHVLSETVGDGDGYPERGETINIPIRLQNAAGSATATGVSGTLSETSPYVTITDNSATWPNISAGTNQQSNPDHFTFTVASDDATCGHVANFTIAFTADGGYNGSSNFTVTLGCPAPNLDYVSHTIDDVAGGDGDGYPERNETISLPVVLRHVSGANAQNVSGKLRCTSAYVTVTDSMANWPNIAVGGSQTSLTDHFAFTVGSTTPNGHVAQFLLLWTCYCGSGVDTFYITLGGPTPKLVYSAPVIFNDVVGGDGDNYPEPGETVVMQVRLKNTGTATATSISGRLTETSIYISMTDNASSWPNIAVGDSQYTSPNHFAFYVDPATPCGHVVNFTLIDTCNTNVVDTNTFNITISTPTPKLGYLSHTIDDVAGGDGDGYPERNETIRLPVVLRHVSGANAHNVSGKLRTTSPYITVIDSMANWPNIAVGGSQTSLTDHFAFTVGPTAPNGHVAQFILPWTCFCGSGTDTFYITLGGLTPKLVYSAPVILNDAVGGDGDNYPEPGETVVMQVRLKNTGTATATSISGRLTETSIYISMTDNASLWPNIAVGDSQYTSPNHFAFYVDPATPCGHVVNFTLIDTCNTDVVDTNTFNITISSPAPTLSFSAITINDTLGGDGDTYPEQGETFFMRVVLFNSAATNAQNVTGTISLSDPYISIIDNSADWVTIPGSGSGATVAPHFQLQASPNTPWLYSANISLAWTSFCGSGNINIPIVIGDPNDSMPDPPALLRPFPFERIGNGSMSTTPTLSWHVPNDPNDGDKLHFEVRRSLNYDMSSSVAISSRTNTAGFSPALPTMEGVGTASYIVGSQAEGSLVNGSTYWWDARAFDGNRWGNRSGNRSFTISTSHTQSDWFQTTNEQFARDVLTNVTIGSGSVYLSTGSGNTGFLGPTAHSDASTRWNNPEYVYTNGDSASMPRNGDNCRFYNYNLTSTIPSGATILGIVVRTDAWRYMPNSDRRITIELSWNAGTNWTTGRQTGILPDADPNGSVTLGGTADTWGRTWTTDELSNANFRVRASIQSPGTSFVVWVDWIAVDIYWSYNVPSGTIRSTMIEFSWLPGAVSWGSVVFTDDETYGDIKYQVLYDVSGTATLIPDAVLPGNSTGFGTSPISLMSLNPAIYNKLYLQANLTNIGGTPYLHDWAVSWSPAILGVEVYKGGPTGPRYNTTTWNIGNIAENAQIVMSVGDCAFIKNTGNVIVDIRLKAETAGGWTLGDFQGPNQILLMGLFDLADEPPTEDDFTTPTDVLNGTYKLSGSTDSGAFATASSNGVNVSIGAGRYLYLLFGSPTVNTIPTTQTITVSVEVIVH